MNDAPVALLRRLWKVAFGDPDAFLDRFFARGFSPERSLWIEGEDRVSAALYWLDGLCRDEKLAYIYAVATDPADRGQGLCRKLMAQARETLRQQGYAGAVLVPGEPPLVTMYEKMGYRFCGGIDTVRCVAGEDPGPWKPADQETYCQVRRQLLPDGAVIQEGAAADLLEGLGAFYVAEGGCLWAAPGPDGTVIGELLGDPALSSAAVYAAGGKQGVFRTPGTEPFAMFLPLKEMPAPTYFGHAFD